MHSSLKQAILDQIRNCNNWKSFKQIHAHILTTGLVHDYSVSNSVVDYFGKYIAVVDYACDHLRLLDWQSSSFPFNALVSGYASGNVPRAGFLVYRKIVRRGFVPDSFTFQAVFKSCAKFSGIKEGRQVHSVVVRMGFSSNEYVQNSLVHFYGACGDYVSARQVFDEMTVRDVVTWTCLISGCARTGLFDEALELFLEMDVERSVACFVSALVACGRRGYLNLGKGIQGLVFKRPVEISLVLGNALVDMYVKCQCLSDAKRAFNELSERDVVSWNCMISGLVQHQLPKESLELFYKMQHSGIEPDQIILTSVLSACASIGALGCGRWIHEYIDRKNIKRDVQIGTSLIDMYAKCGCIDMALQTFNEMPSRNVITWNALLGGLALHGHGSEAIKRFEEMNKSSTRPNQVTFLAILTACCHSGLVNEGRRYFHQMTQQPHKISPGLGHYGCMVDLFCRAGLLDEAKKFITAMPIAPDLLIWGTLLSACINTGNIELSKEISNRLLEIESGDSGAYVLLSNIYATNKKWIDVTRFRGLMKKKGIRKTPGSSVIEVDGKAHEFLVGDTRHPQIEEILVLLKFLANQVCLEGSSQNSFDIQV